MKKEKGYTLAEIIATVAILSIFLVSMPMFISTIMNGEKRMNDGIQYSSYANRIIQVLDEKDNSFFEKMDKKIIKFKFSSIEDIYKAFNGESIELGDDKINAEVKIKKVQEKSDGLYLINISIANLSDKALEMKREILVRRVAS